ncbi:hypothetical protein Tco_1389764, partial [Tanacetum coccineum]
DFKGSMVRRSGNMVMEVLYIHVPLVVTGGGEVKVVRKEDMTAASSEVTVMVRRRTVVKGRR